MQHLVSFLAKCFMSLLLFSFLLMGFVDSELRASHTGQNSLVEREKQARVVSRRGLTKKFKKKSKTKEQKRDRSSNRNKETAKKSLDPNQLDVAKKRKKRKLRKKAGSENLLPGRNRGIVEQRDSDNQKFPPKSLEGAFKYAKEELTLCKGYSLEEKTTESAMKSPRQNCRALFKNFDFEENQDQGALTKLYEELIAANNKILELMETLSKKTQPGFMVTCFEISAELREQRSEVRCNDGPPFISTHEFNDVDYLTFGKENLTIVDEIYVVFNKLSNACKALESYEDSHDEKRMKITTDTLDIFGQLLSGIFDSAGSRNQEFFNNYLEIQQN